MERILHIEESLLRSRRWLALAIAAALAVLGGVVAFTTLQLRERIREQMAGRDGEVLHAVALLYYEQEREDGLSVADPGAQLSIVLKCSELRGILGVRLYDAHGRLVETFPPDVTEQALSPEDRLQLGRSQPVSRFHPNKRMGELFYSPELAEGAQVVPLLEVNVPLHTENGPLAGVAQFLVAGHGIAAEFARLDQRLAWQAIVAFSAGGMVLALSLAWAFRRLRRAHQLLAERTGNLVRANQELALAAKTSALGAVTAHLIHGLKNPLAGLQNFVAARGAAPEGNEGVEWQQAVASTRRMQAMIEQVVGVLREEQSGSHYEVTLAELEEQVRGRVQTLARERGVNFTAVRQDDANLPNRVANLVTLILVNLVENAVLATPSGKAATLILGRVDDRLLFEVRDEGTGFPADTPLFMPCRSSRAGGSGIGLALCKQLANHLGAELELSRSTPAGCVFALKLPRLNGSPEDGEPGRIVSDPTVRPESPS